MRLLVGIRSSSSSLPPPDAYQLVEELAGKNARQERNTPSGRKRGTYSDSDSSTCCANFWVAGLCRSPAKVPATSGESDSGGLHHLIRIMALAYLLLREEAYRAEEQTLVMATGSCTKW